MSFNILLCVLTFSTGRSLVHSIDYSNLRPVVFANVLYRHGDRTPIEPYPMDPYNNLSYWPTGWGQLTNVGKRQQYALGQWLMKRYETLLSNIYSREDIYVQSTDMDRTLMSAECNLAGLYPPTGNQMWNTYLNWQPLPVHTVPKELDKILAMKAPCTQYDIELRRLEKSSFMQALDKKFQPLYTYLTEHTGKKIHDVENVESIYNTLFIEDLYNMTLPDWTTSVYPEPMKTVAAYSFAIPTYNKPLQRLKSGPLLGEMLEHMTDKSQGKLSPDRKLWIYSAHDTTVSNLLMALGLFDLHNPPYTATVLLELRADRDNTSYYVTVSYRNSTVMDEAHLLTVPGCATECPLEDFIRITGPVIPADWDAECHAHHLFDLTSDLPYNSIAIFAMVTASLLLFMLMAAVSIYLQKPKNTHWYRKLKTETS